MKISLVFLTGLCTLALISAEQHTVDKVFLTKQKQILELVYHINQPNFYPEYVDIAKTYSIADNVDQYSNPEAVENFLRYYKYSLLPRGTIFSIFQESHAQQAIALFKVLYHAKDWETFYKTAVWARQQVNEGLFVYSFSVAVLHRPDATGLVLPPIYEIYPHYFYSSEVINKAHYYKQIHDPQEHDKKNLDFNGYIVDSNYSGWYLNLHPEQSLSYYLEDVDLNAFYYYFNLRFPFWMNSKEYGYTNSRRGEIYYYLQQLLFSRYYLERLSNGFGEIPYIDWNEPIETPYTPSLVYPNGLEFPSRPKFANLHEYFYHYGQKWSSEICRYRYSYLRDHERRMNDAAVTGYVIGEHAEFIKLQAEEGLNIFGNIIEANADSPNPRFYYPISNFVRHLLGYSYHAMDVHKLTPSALEHYETSLRDPVFHQLVRKIQFWFQKYLSYVSPYTENELVLPGVKITNVEMDSLITYWDHSYADLTNAVWYNSDVDDHSFQILVRQQRLNHKPFNYKLHVKSDKDQKVAVKVFLGPKYDEYGRHLNFTKNRLYFVELEHFVYDLKSGENGITRNSSDFYYFGPDRVSGRTLYHQVTAALERNEPFHVNWYQNDFHWPQRYLLPKGSEEGTPYQFFFFVYPYTPYQGELNELDKKHFSPDGLLFDNHPLGYPLNRFIHHDKFWETMPNSYFHEAKIYLDVHGVNVDHHDH